MAFIAAINSYTVLPKIKPIYFFIAAFSIGVIAILINISDLQMTTVNSFGMVDRHFSAISFILLNFLLFISFFPPCLGLIYHSIKSNQITAKGIMFAIGAFMFPFFGHYLSQQKIYLLLYS
jgi:hypothetical protein